MPKELEKITYFISPDFNIGPNMDIDERDDINGQLRNKDTLYRENVLLQIRHRTLFEESPEGKYKRIVRIISSPLNTEIPAGILDLLDKRGYVQLLKDDKILLGISSCF